MKEFLEPRGALIPEWADKEELEKKLKGLGWEDGKKYGLVEDLFLESFIHNEIFEQKFNELNDSLLKDLTEPEKREVLDHVKNILRNATEENLLEYLKNGIQYTVKRSESRTFRLIDYENPENNSLIYAREIKYPGKPRNIKPDFSLFVNGIPLAIIEVKPSTQLESENDAVEQIRRYEQESPELFRYTQLAVAYGHRKLFLPTYPNWSKEVRLTSAQPWKVEKQKGRSVVKIESIEHLLQPTILLNLIKWYTFFREKDGSISKIVGRYNQYMATEKTLQRIGSYLDGEEEIDRGLIWHWQGSGKTYTMFFIANMFFEKYLERNPVVIFVVDRKDLQKQLVDDFLEAIKAPKFKDYLKRIESIEELKQEIATIKRSEYKQNVITKRIYVVLIQKFQREEFENLLLELAQEQLQYLEQMEPDRYREIQDQLQTLPEDEKRRKLMEIGGIQKKEVLLLIDEAHRSQYGLLASMMKNVFPRAIRYAFTGTPVFKFERNTFLEFAYPPKEFYTDVYFIKDSIDDHFTLPIVYDVIQEGKPVVDGIRILLQDEDIKEYIEGWIETSRDGSPADDIESFLESGEAPSHSPVITKSDLREHLNNIRVFLTNEKRLEKLARHIAERVEADTENFKFKAMVVTANREACVIMKRYLDRELEKLYARKYGEQIKEWTEIVMTYDYNDTDLILDYKEKLIERRGKSDTNEINMEIRDEFKEKENPKILIVTDMLITGFDAPKLKVMYLDKPLYEHRLLQAIARVNRPYKDDVIEKKYGLVIDSVGLLKHLRKSIRKFELIADRRIAADIEENVLGRIEQKLQDFKQNLSDLKNFMRDLRVEGRDLSIDIDRIRKEIRVNKIRALESIKQIIDPKTRLMAAFWDTLEIQTLLKTLKETIEQFKALGSHKEKIFYIDDVQILSYIYGRILYYMRGSRIPKEFWDGLIELIHEKTLVEDFQTIIRTEINNDLLKRTLEDIREKISAREVIQEQTVADAYRMLRSLLEMDLSNPVYKTIYERIERKREEWITRNIDTAIFVQTLVDSIEEKIRYDEKISTKPLAERIIDTMNMLINQQFGEDKMISLEFRELKKTIKEVAKAARVVPTHESMLRTALLKDLFMEMKSQKGDITSILTYLKNFAETVTKEYIVAEIERAKGNGAT